MEEEIWVLIIRYTVLCFHNPTLYVTLTGSPYGANAIIITYYVLQSGCPEGVKSLLIHIIYRVVQRWGKSLSPLADFIAWQPYCPIGTTAL